MNEHLSIKTLELLSSRQSYRYSHIPCYKDGNCGVYLIKFPNGKRYVGSSNHIFRRLREHLNSLAGSCKFNSWYETAIKENNYIGDEAPPQDPRDKKDKNGRRMGKRVSEKEMMTYYYNYQLWKEHSKKDKNKILSTLLINIFYCDDYREFESAILKSIPEEEKQFWYNSKFS